MISTLLLWSAAVVALCSVAPAVLFLFNLRRYRPPAASGNGGHALAVLIPARNEEANIANCLQSVLASEDVQITVLVLDDASTDCTAAIVASIAAQDPRVRLLETVALPGGWNGKQHACWLLANATTATHMVFLDADVRLEPQALRRCMAHLLAKDLTLLSGFPRQQTVGFLEQLLLPMIHFILLSFLPMGRMDKTTSPAFSAGCGQFFLVEREAYLASGGHAAIRMTRHDGLRLPELMRAHGYRTGLVDLTALAHVRMYNSARAVWMGLAKNATEGIAAPMRLVPMSLLLVLGQVVPTLAALAWLVFLVSATIVGATFDDPPVVVLVTLALLIMLAASYGPRIIAAQRFAQPMRSALLHPAGILVLLAVQWYALGKQLMRSPILWRART